VIAPRFRAAQGRKGIVMPAQPASNSARAALAWRQNAADAKSGKQDDPTRKHRHHE
jgi:hypothetical protein